MMQSVMALATFTSTDTHLCASSDCPKDGTIHPNQYVTQWSNRALTHMTCGPAEGNRHAG